MGLTPTLYGAYDLHDNGGLSTTHYRALHTLYGLTTQLMWGLHYTIGFMTTLYGAYDYNYMGLTTTRYGFYDYTIWGYRLTLYGAYELHFGLTTTL